MCEIPSDFEEDTNQESDAEDESCSKDPLYKVLGEESVEEYDPIQQHENPGVLLLLIAVINRILLMANKIK